MLLKTTYIKQSHKRKFENKKNIYLSIHFLCNLQIA